MIVWIFIVNVIVYAFISFILIVRITQSQQLYTAVQKTTIERKQSGLKT